MNRNNFGAKAILALNAQPSDAPEFVRVIELTEDQVFYEEEPAMFNTDIDRWIDIAGILLMIFTAVYLGAHVVAWIFR